MITITNEARDRINKIRKSGEMIRISISSGGCHGFSYKFSLDSNVGADDLVFEDLVVMQEKLSQKINNPTLDFKKNISSSYFVLESESFDTKCGCGTSFSLKS